MNQAGRKSAASLSVVGGVTTINRLRAPETLTESESVLWAATINSKPAEWFGPEHVPLLVEYVRHVSTADMLTKQIQDFDPKWLEDGDGVKRLKDLTAMRAREAGVINTLARSMRITHQAVYRADKAATIQSRGGRKPWQSES